MDTVSVFSPVWYSITPFNLRFFSLILGNVSIISSNSTTFLFLSLLLGLLRISGLFLFNLFYLMLSSCLLEDPQRGLSTHQWFFSYIHPTIYCVFYFNYYILHTNISHLVLICDLLCIFYFSSIFPYLFQYPYFAHFKFSLLVILLQVIYGVRFVFFFFFFF